MIRRSKADRAIASMPIHLAMKILVLTFSSLASTCALVNDDGFPSWLAYVESSVDLDTVNAYVQASPYKGVSRLEYVPFTATDGSDAATVLAYADGQSSEVLLAFDSRLKAVGSWLRGDTPPMKGLGPVMHRSVRGFISGKLEFNPTDMNASPQIITMGVLPSDYCVFYTETPARNYMVAKETPIPGEHILSLQGFDEDFNALGAPMERSLDTSKNYMRILDAEFSGGMYRVLVETNSGGYAFSFQDEPGFLNPVAFLEDPNADITGPFWLSDGKAWLTDDGVVTFVRYEGNHLLRYQYGQKDTIIDSLLLGDDIDGLDILSFDTSGTWWFMHKRLNGLLYKMRTWWS